MVAPEVAAAVAGRRVLATDLDGTLLRPDLTIGPKTQAAIADALAAGIKLVFVTGRPPRWMRAVAREAGHAGTAICVNGAVLLDLAREQVVSRTMIDAAAAHEVAQGLRSEFGDEVKFAVERVAVAPMPSNDSEFGAGSPTEFARELGFLPRLYPPDKAPTLPLPGLLELPDVVKMLARLELPAGADPMRVTDQFAAVADGLADGRLEVTHSSDHVLLEFGPAGVTKATALAKLVASWGMSAADVVAVGDMPNDLAMLEWAGVGLAVEDAHHRAKAAANHHVPGPLDDGVGRVLAAMITG